MPRTDITGTQYTVGDGQRSVIRTDVDKDFVGRGLDVHVQDRSSGEIPMRTGIQSRRRTDKQLRRHRVVDRRHAAVRL